MSENLLSFGWDFETTERHGNRPVNIWRSVYHHFTSHREKDILGCDSGGLMKYKLSLRLVSYALGRNEVEIIDFQPESLAGEMPLIFHSVSDMSGRSRDVGRDRGKSRRKK